MKCPLVIAFLLLTAFGTLADEFREQVQPFLQRYCVKCHGGEKVKGGVDFTTQRNDADLDAAFETWASALELIREGEMPPDAARQPSAAELESVFKWYQQRFVASVAAHPGYHKPRRLSAREFRNTLRSVFGFDLEVAVIEAEQTRVEKSLVLKLLPTDPPGRSGYRNDTHGNPLTTAIWDQYAYLIDQALERLFSPARLGELCDYTGPISADGMNHENLRRLLKRFLPRARRRPVDKSIIDHAFDRVAAHPDLLTGLKMEMKAALLAPTFIYRGLLVTTPPGQPEPVDEFELAERLSYFLWNDMPDEELSQLARSGKLRDHLDAQLQRMLDSARSRAFAEDFATQWLVLDSMDQFAKRQLPTAVALKTQPIRFLEYLIAEDRPLLELIDSKVTFANPLLARFYRGDRQQIATYRKAKGIELETIPHSRITLGRTKERGGILTMPGILAMNRGPVQRGSWMLERVLGVHLPDPPPNVGQVEPNRGGRQLSFRERFEKHRADPTCAVCHDKIDPLGFALQRYDTEGAFQQDGAPTKRKQRNSATYGGGPIDTSGRLPDGETFKDFAELKQILLEKKRGDIIRNLVKQTLSYALCRKLEIRDQPTVERITSSLQGNNGTWRDLIRAVVRSLPFQQTVIKGTNS